MKYGFHPSHQERRSKSRDRFRIQPPNYQNPSRSPRRYSNRKKERDNYSPRPSIEVAVKNAFIQDHSEIHPKQQT